MNRVQTKLLLLGKRGAGVAATTFNPATASGSLTLTNGNLSIQGSQFSGNCCSARATAVAAAAKTRFELLLVSQGAGGWDSSNPMVCGVDDATNDFVGGFPEPGHDPARPGVDIRIFPTGWNAFKAAASFASGSDAFVVGDSVGCEIDQAGGTVKFTKIHSGSETTLTTVTGVSLSAWYAFASQFRDNKSTGVFKAPFVGTLSGGFSAYGS